jgi:lysyl endopeptidase
MSKSTPVLLLSFLLLCLQAKAQLQEDKIPYSQRQGLKSLLSVEFNLKKPNVDSIKSAEASNSKARPYKFGEKIFVDYSMATVGKWSKLSDGGRLWLFDIKADEALSLNFIFNKFKIPAGAEFYIYNEQNRLGAFTYKNNQADEKFATTVLRGDHVRLEYYEPAGVAFEGEIILSEIIYGFLDVFKIAKAYGSSGSCNVNAVCDPTWESQKRSVVMLVVNGNGFCSGALINNTSQDLKPYVLTANHCYSGNESTWVFWFNWEAPTCTYSGASPSYTSLSGSILRSRGASSDYCLVEINSQVPSSYNPFYAGWNKSSTPATSGASIHHPAADIKKISTYNTSTILSSYGSSSNQHWRVNWATAAITEGGSSGSPLFDQNKRIVGQLHGGPSFCGAPSGSLNDYYGALHMSFPAGLGTYLDPTNTGVTTLDGTNACTVAATLSPTGTQPFCAGTTPDVQLTVTNISGATYQWLKDGQPVGTNSNTYLASQTGTYTVRVTSGTCIQIIGSMQLAAPSTQTMSITATNNQMICSSFSQQTVLRISPKPMGATYQWLMNGTNIAGETKDSLVVSSAGNYTVQRVFCTVNASSNALTVTAPAQASLPAVQSRAVCPFENSITPNYTLQATPNCTANATVTSTTGVVGYDNGGSSGTNPTINNTSIANPIKITVSITFEKKAGGNQSSCATAHNGGDPYNNELSFRIKNPTGVIATLIPSANYTSTTYGSTVTIVFDDLAANPLNTTYPISGTYRPSENLTTKFGSLNALGTWELLPADNASTDPLCVKGFSMTFTNQQIVEWRSVMNGPVLSSNASFTPSSPIEGVNDFFVRQLCGQACPSNDVPVNLTLDCNCANSSDITVSGVINNTKQAAKSIVSGISNSVNPTNVIDYKAGQSVTLMPGFVSTPSAVGVFKAEVEGCNNN